MLTDKIATNDTSRTLNSGNADKPSLAPIIMRDPFAQFLSQFLLPRRLEVCEKNLHNRTRHITVVLEDLHQTHNASACLRSCDAFGLQDVHIIENDYEYIVNPDIELGSAQWLTTHRYNEQPHNTKTCLEKLKADGYRIIATSPHADSLCLEELDITSKTALMFGHERDGLSDIACAHADAHMRIPMFGFAESFNISVAVAICLHHLTWKLRNSEIDWRLSNDERDAVLDEWLLRIFADRLPTLRREYERRVAEDDLRAR